MMYKNQTGREAGKKRQPNLTQGKAMDWKTKMFACEAYEASMHSQHPFNDKNLEKTIEEGTHPEPPAWLKEHLKQDGKAN